MRPRRDRAPAKATAVGPDEVAAARRYRRLGHWSLTAECEPHIAKKIRAERQRIDESRAGPVARLERLETVLADLNVLAAAETFADRIEPGCDRAVNPGASIALPQKRQPKARRRKTK